MRSRSFAVSLLFMMSLCGPFSGTAAADGLDTLYQRTFAIDFYDYASGNGAQVAVGSFFYDNSQGNVVTSTNGVDWKQVKLAGEMPDCVDTVTFFNGHFIVPGLGAVYTSTDGLSWVKAPEADNFELNDIAVGNNLLVGVGTDSSISAQGTIMKSTDGVTWIPVASGLMYGVHAVAYGAGSDTFAAVSGGTIYTYQSGYVSNRGDFSYTLGGIAYGNGTFVAVGARGTIVTSTNTAKGNSNNEGTYWTVRSPGTTHDLSSVAYGNGTFVAVGSDEILGETVMTSPDGITWTQQTFGFPTSCTKIRFDGSKFLVMGKDGLILTSPDGIAWTTVIPATPGPIGKPVTNGSVIVATESLQGAVLTSPDGVRWTARYLPNKEHITKLAYGKGMFVGIGRDDAGTQMVMTSVDGIAWTRHDLGFSVSVADMAFGNNAFVIVTGGSTIYTSTDAVTWIPGSLSDYPSSVTFSNGTFIAVGRYTVYSSPDGFNWSGYAANLQLFPSEILSGSVTSVIVDDLGGLFTSSGHKNWRQRTSPFSYGSELVGFGNNTFMAAGGSGGLLTSNDGKTWVDRVLTPLFIPYGAVFFNDYFVITGENYYSTATTENVGGMIFQSATMAPVAPPAAVPEIDFSPSSINYGYVKRGDSVTKTITIRSTWTGPLSTTVQLTGANTGDFPITGGTCGSQNVLAPDDSCTIDVTFKPTTAFTRNAQVVVTSNDPVTSVVTIPLTGVGVQPIITPPSPLPFNLGTSVYPMWVGNNVIIYNRGNDDLKIASATLTGSSEFSVNFEDCTGATVSAGGLCGVQILFKPQSAGPRTATVTIKSNDPDYPTLDIPIIVNALPQNPVLITGSTPTYVTSLQAACDQAVDGATIDVEGVTFLESIIIRKALTLKGGFDSTFYSSSGFTSVQGLIVMDGPLTVENLVIL